MFVYFGLIYVKIDERSELGLLLIKETMTGGSLGIRSGSYGSLDKQLQNTVLLPIQVPLATRSKPSKVFKEKETLVHWICKLAGRKKVGMLLLSVISAAVFVWVVYVGKGWFISPPLFLFIIGLLLVNFKNQALIV